MNKDKGYLVVIEWDGDKPTNAFYHRIRALTSGVRQNDSEEARSISPVARRSERESRAVIMQEGAIYCVSRSLARGLALVAKEYGAKSVEVANVTNMSPIEATAEDIEALKRINSILGRRGRPPAKITRDVIFTCYEELISKQLTVDGKILNCPTCGSLSVKMMYGIPNAFQKEDIEQVTRWGLKSEHSMFYKWIRSRTAHWSGITFMPFNFVLSKDVRDGKYKYDYMIDAHDGTSMLDFETGARVKKIVDERVNVYPEDEKKILKKMIYSDFNNLDALMQFPDYYVKILDSIFASSFIYTEEERLEGRLSALSLAMMRYPDTANKYMLALNEDHYDIFDSAPVMSAKEIVDYYSIVHDIDRNMVQLELA